MIIYEKNINNWNSRVYWFHLAKSLLNQKIIVIGVDNHNSYYDVKIKKDK